MLCEEEIRMGQLIEKGLFDDFTGVFSKSLTLKFGLIPDIRTDKFLKEYWDRLQDENRNLAYPIVKRVLDREYQKLITRVLSEMERESILDWTELAALLNGKNVVEQKKLEKIQEKLRKDISDKFTHDEAYSMLFGEKPFGPKGYLTTQILSKEEREAVNLFDRFSTFFSNYYENRKNYFSSENKSTAVANRIVNENFPKHVNNVFIFAKVKQYAPELINKVGEQLCAKYDNWEILFTVNGYNYALTQKGIDTYNEVVGIYNSLANVYYQQNSNKLEEGHPLKKRKTSQLTILFKQIASDKEDKIKIDKFNTDKEVFEKLIEVQKHLNEIAIIEKFNMLYEERQSFSKEGVYISSKSLSEVSIYISKGMDNQKSGKWNTIDEALTYFWKNELFSKVSEDKLEGKIEKQKKSAYSMTEIQQALDYMYSLSGDVCIKIDLWYNRLDEILKNIEEATIKLEDTLHKWNRDGLKSLKEDNIDFLKHYLDAWLDLVRYCKSFQCNDLVDVQREEGFYSFIENIVYELDDIIYFYNKVRNYVTQKPYSIDKIPLKFGNPTLADGWMVDKEKDYCTTILKKDKYYYLAVMNPLKSKRIISTQKTMCKNGYQKMIYRQFKDVSKMIPKCSTQLNEVKAHFEKSDDNYILNSDKFVKALEITKEQYLLNNKLYGKYKKWQKDYLKNNPEDKKGYADAVRKWNAFCMAFMTSYKNTALYDYSEIIGHGEYDSVADLYAALDKIVYQIEFEYVAEETIDKMVSEGEIFLFKIYNQDYSEHKKAGSNKNLHTLYWEALFSEENARENIIKLNGGAEIFMRPASIKNPVIHKAGEILVNKRTKDGTPIPDSEYVILCRYFNNSFERLTDEQKEIVEKYKNQVYTSTKCYDLVKDKRFTEDKFEFHVPITINYQADGIRLFNTKVLQTLQKYPDVNILGLDRGERNLISYTLVNQQGRIIRQGSFNEINKINYQEKLAQKERARLDERQSWKHVENIKELKEGYLSQVIHEIAKMMVEYNAIVVMENLNFGFKKGRFKVERQVYQKFEVALLQKLQYLVVNKKEDNVLQHGGILKGFQLSTEVPSLKNIGKQCGFVFYVPAGYTSKIDPTTGFVDVFDMSKVTNQSTRKDFFAKFDDIFYDKKRDMFAFSFNYENFAHYQTMAKSEWVVYTNGSKYIWHNQREECVNPTEEIKKMLEENGIDYLNNSSLKGIIVNTLETNNKLGEKLFYMFRIVLRLRNSSTSNKLDQIISPVLNSKGEFFETPRVIDDKAELTEYPVDADTNGAYHIALKGLYLLNEKFSTLDLEEGKIPKEAYDISNAEWFAYRQNK